MHLRNVPTNPECLGEAALSNEPAIKQVFITGVTDDKVPVFERILQSCIRKRIEKRISDPDFYICSLSNSEHRIQGYAECLQLRQYYPDLTNNYFTSGLAPRPLTLSLPNLPNMEPGSAFPVCSATTVRSTPYEATAAG